MNKAIFIGNLANNPELKVTTQGTHVCRFQLAVNRDRKAQNGKRPVDYFSIIAWRELGDLCSKYLATGRKVMVEGSVQNRSYDSSDGSKRWVTEIIAEKVEFLSPKESGKAYQQENGVDPVQPADTMAKAANDNQGDVDIDDDDLPF